MISLQPVVGTRQTRFSEIIKALGSTGFKETIAVQAEQKISEIFLMNNQLDSLSKRERERLYNLTARPKVNAFFARAKSVMTAMATQGRLPKRCNIASIRSNIYAYSSRIIMPLRTTILLSKRYVLSLSDKRTV